ncbi:MAG: c-type cytochrome [Elusimicrobiota bacterium]
MIRWLPAALLLACGAALLRGDSPPAMRIGVLKFDTADAAVSGAAAGDLFSAALYRNFPGLSVVGPAQVEAVISREHLPRGNERLDPEAAGALQNALEVDALASGTIMALETNADGGGGTLMIGARLMKLPSGEILWADTRTVRIGAPLLKRMLGAPRESDAVLAGKLLELGVFQLVQDLGQRLPEEALAPTDRGAGERSDERCAPPAFYETLARDADWFYGVGKDPDTDKARAAALANLALQATGRADGLATDTGLLAGWEQDDFRRCKGFSYVMVRIGKARVREFLARNPGAGANTVLQDLKRRLDVLESSNSRILDRSAENPRRSLAPLLMKDTIASVKALIGSGTALDQVVRANVASTEMIFSDLLRPQARCGGTKCPGGPTLEQAGFIARARRKIAAGTIAVDDVVSVHAIFAHYSKADDDREFLEAVISRKRPAAPSSEDYEHTRELAFPLAWSAALARDDWARFFKYCTDYLRMFPQGIYAAAAEKNRENAADILMLRNMEISAAPSKLTAVGNWVNEFFSPPVSDFHARQQEEISKAVQEGLDSLRTSSDLEASALVPDEPRGRPADSEPISAGEDSAAIARGRELYQRDCVRCHGIEGKGSPAVIAMFRLSPEAMDLTRVNLDAYSPDGLSITLKDGKKAMPEYKKALSREDAHALLEYLRRLRDE